MEKSKETHTQRTKLDTQTENEKKNWMDKWGEQTHKRQPVKVCGQTGRKLWQSLPISGGTLMLLACVMRLSNTHKHTHIEAQQYSGLNINHRGWQVICRGAPSSSLFNFLSFRPSHLISLSLSFFSVSSLARSLALSLLAVSENCQRNWKLKDGFFPSLYTSFSQFPLHPSIRASFPPLISPPWRPLLSLPVAKLFQPFPFHPSSPRSFSPSICWFACLSISSLQALVFRMCRLNTWHGLLKSPHTYACQLESKREQ